MRKIQRLLKENRAQLERVHEIFLAAYTVEAELLGVHAEAFFPLRQSIEDLRISSDEVWCSLADNAIQGAIFLEKSENTILISNLVVDPPYFRKGIAHSLVVHSLQTYPDFEFRVSTGSKNLPAIRLYLSLGFQQTGQKTLPPGIQISDFHRVVRDP